MAVVVWLPGPCVPCRLPVLLLWRSACCLPWAVTGSSAWGRGRGWLCLLPTRLLHVTGLQRRGAAWLGRMPGVAASLGGRILRILLPCHLLLLLVLLRSHLAWRPAACTSTDLHRAMGNYFLT